jgi:undecaprenyl-phosphate 4-deoxy-4-formamido-L-arabinose transferase
VSEIVNTVSKLGESYAYEIILVNDCSPDDTKYAVMELCNGNPLIKGLSFSRNFGQHSAVMAGFTYAAGDYVVNLDDDGQTPVDRLPELIKKLEENYDIVFAKYIETYRRGIIRRAGTYVKESLNCYILGKPRAIALNSFFIARKFVIDEVLKYTNPYPYLGGLLLRASSNIANVEVPHRSRKEGSSTYTMRKLAALMLNEFTSFSVKPLRIASVFGFMLSVLGLIFAGAVIVNKIINPDISAGWSSTIALILLLGGIQMIITGLAGEYIGRIYISLNKAPQYVIREYYNIDHQTEKE